MKNLDALPTYTPEVPLAVEEKKLQRPLTRLSANENPLGTSPAVKSAMVNWNFDTNLYPDGNASQLRLAVATKQKVAPEQLVFGCGLDEIIQIICRTYLDAKSVVLEPWPTFSEYKLHSQIQEANVVDVPINWENGQFDLNALVTKVTSKTSLIWICNPNNPTGTMVPLTQLRNFLEKIPESVLVVIDEAYMEFADNQQAETALNLLADFKNIIVLRTFSKAYGIANLRVGYGVLPKNTADYLQTVRLPYNLNDLSQVGAWAALKDQAFLQKTVENNRQERQKWENFLQDNGLKYFKSQTNFIFFQISKSATLAAYLKANGFLVRTGLSENWLRITIAQPAQNQQVQTLIQYFIDENK